MREGRKEGGRERNINVWLHLECPLLGTWPATQACVLTGNWTCNPLVLRKCSIHRVTPTRALFCIFMNSGIFFNTPPTTDLALNGNINIWPSPIQYMWKTIRPGEQILSFLRTPALHGGERSQECPGIPEVIYSHFNNSFIELSWLHLAF